jgi:hypothetical protein
MNMLMCPDCGGKKTMMAFVDGRRPDGTPFGGVKRINCFTCKGTGQIDERFAARRVAGKALRDARIAKGQSLLEAAKERGISPTELSAIEQGRAVAPTDGAVK